MFYVKGYLSLNAPNLNINALIRTPLNDLVFGG